MKLYMLVNVVQGTGEQAGLLAATVCLEGYTRTPILSRFREVLENEMQCFRERASSTSTYDIVEVEIPGEISTTEFDLLEGIEDEPSVQERLQ